MTLLARRLFPIFVLRPRLPPPTLMPLLEPPLPPPLLDPRPIAWAGEWHVGQCVFAAENLRRLPLFVVHRGLEHCFILPLIPCLQRQSTPNKAL